MSRANRAVADVMMDLSKEVRRRFDRDVSRDTSRLATMPVSTSRRTLSQYRQLEEDCGRVS